MGGYREGKIRPVIVKFASFKLKNQLLLCGHKLKGSPYSLSEDYSPNVRTARKFLLDFARAQNVSFKLRFDKLHIGSRTYSYDSQSLSVKEIPR